jgi:glycosyltransferase involved in cell wall biosynthesis
VAHWEAGTREPERDLCEPAGETAFGVALREARPQLVHVHELARLPSSVLELARDAGVPVVMTLHDYRPLCASVRLLDADGRRCTRLEVGEDCARNCAGAPAGRGHLVAWTVGYELGRAKRAVPGASGLDFSFLSRRRDPPPPPGPPAPAAGYQRRRDVNVARLARCERLIAPSARSAEIYAGLGVPAESIRVQRLTLPHIDRLRPTRPLAVHAPLTFATLNGAASAAKGAHVLLDALRRLPGEDFRLRVFGRAGDALAADPRVTLEGAYEPAELDGRLEGVDVGIVPSVWEESHGFVGPELLAKGIPVIGSALGGIAEYVRDGETGWLNRSATGEELARLMADAIRRPEHVLALQREVVARRAELVKPMAAHLAEVEALYGELS